MSNQSSNQLRGLTASNARVVNAESFTDGQRRAVDRYIGLSKCSGVLVGAHVGTAAWDLRPLLLEEGKLTLLRFSEPSLVLQKAKFAWLKGQLQRKLTWGPRPQSLSCGEEGGQLWLKRSYFQKVLTDPGAPGSEGPERLQLLQALITQLRALHQSGLVHGHLAPGNMVFEDRSLFLFDAAFHCALVTPEPSQFLAPEVAANMATPASDVYSLGVFVTHLLKGECPPSLRLLAERAMESDPAKRPQLAEIEDQLTRLASGAAAKSPSQTSPGGSAAARGGRMISATVTTPANPEPPPVTRKSYHPPERIARELKQTVMLPRDLIAEARKDVLGEAAPKPPVAPQPPAPVAKEEPPVSTPPPAWDEPKAAAPQTLPAVKEEKPRASSVEITTSKQPILIVCGIVLLIAVILVRVTGLHHLVGGKSYNIPFDEYWRSGQKSLMSQVAEAAIAGGVESARITIISDALKGGSSALAHESLLRFVFNPRWEQQLSDSDKDAALKLALNQLYPEGKESLPPFDQLNPVIIIGTMSDIPLEKELGVLSKLPISLLTAAPAPLDAAFKGLAASGSRTLGDPQVRALAHLAVGDTSETAFGVFFSSGEPRERLKILAPLGTENPQFYAALLSFLEHGQTLLADYAAWFHGDDVAQWDQAQPALKVMVLLGDVPPSGLSLEQYADLLQFPDEGVRKDAVEILSKNFLGKESHSTMEFLASSRNLMGRFQIVALVSSFKLDPDSFYGFLSKWFEAKPDPSSIVGLLIARNQITGVDALNFQAASYLKKANWDAALSDLTVLSRHPEGLARALAYSKLDPAKPNERAVMQDALKREPNKSFRDELARRLAAPAQ